MPVQFAASNDVRHVLVDGVLSVTIDRPEKRNPLSLGVLDNLRRIFTAAAANPEISLAVITGAGKAFSSGGDLAELSAYREREDAASLARHGTTALDAIRFFPVPVIARINGVALGGGAELALACDFRLASPASRIGFVHGRLRITPPWGGGRDLVRIVGASRALHLLATAAVLTPGESLSMGLVDQVCPMDHPYDTWFDERLTEFRDQPRHVLMAQKAMVSSSRAAVSAAQAQLELQRFCDLWCHEDHWSAAAQFTKAAS